MQICDDYSELGSKDCGSPCCVVLIVKPLQPYLLCGVEEIKSECFFFTAFHCVVMTAVLYRFKVTFSAGVYM